MNYIMFVQYHLSYDIMDSIIVKETHQLTSVISNLLAGILWDSPHQRKKDYKKEKKNDRNTLL